MRERSAMHSGPRNSQSVIARPSRFRSAFASAAAPGQTAGAAFRSNAGIFAVATDALGTRRTPAPRKTN